MNAVFTLAFFLATSATNAAGAYALVLHRQREARAVETAKLTAKADAALARGAEMRDRWRETDKRLQGILEQIGENKRFAASQTAMRTARAERLLRVGNEARRAAEGRCTGAK